MNVKPTIHIELDPPDAPIDGISNEERSREEVEKWWGVPFIVTSTFDDQVDPDYETYVEQVSIWKNTKIKDRKTWETEREEHRKNWYGFFPSGTRYWVKCLDGGAWDRPTEYEAFGSLAEAVDYAKDLLAK